MIHCKMLTINLQTDKVLQSVTEVQNSNLSTAVDTKT